MCSRVPDVVWPPRVVVGLSASIAPPLRSHLTTFCSSPRSADRWISSGSGAGELIAARARPVPLAPRTRVAPPASVPPLVRAAPPLGAAAESRSARRRERRQPATRGVGHLFLAALCTTLVNSYGSSPRN